MPSELGGIVVDANDGRKVWIRPGAFRDEDVYPQAEIRSLTTPSRKVARCWTKQIVRAGPPTLPVMTEGSSPNFACLGFSEVR